MRIAFLSAAAVAVLIAVVVVAVASAAPTVRWTYSPADPYTGEAVMFDGSTTTCDRAPCTYTWTDDGPDGPGGTNWPLGSGQVLTFTFQGAGTKWVRLTVRNARGRSSSVEQTITVLQGPRPGPTPTPTPTATPTSTPTPTPSGGCDLNATTANFRTQLTATQPGQTLCLASGAYGAFPGANKAAPGITVRAATGATPSMSFNLNDATNPTGGIVFDGITVDGLNVSGPTHDVTWRNSHFAGYNQINGAASSSGTNNFCGNCPALNASSNLLFDYDTFDLSDCPTGSCLLYEGRLSFATPPPTTESVTVQNSVFENNCADGIQYGAPGVIIQDNEFRNLMQDSCGPHVDSIQWNGVHGMTVRRNWFHNNSTGIVSYDGGQANLTVTDNVFQNITQDAILDGAGTNNTWVHNTVVNSGPMLFDHDHSGTPSRGEVVRDNVATGGIQFLNGSTATTNDYNLCSIGCAGTHSITGSPVFVGGASPSSYAGFRLASGSPGKSAASDGTDMGIR